MGRSLNWYVVPRECEHDATKKFCFGWEFQDDEEEMESQVLARIKGPIEEWEVISPRDPDYFTKRKAQKEERNSLLYQYLWDYDSEHKESWCPKCRTFARGLYDSPLVLAKEHVNHSYSNPIWPSRWNLKDLYLGSESEYTRLFTDDKYYREIDSYDVEKALEVIGDLGKPFRKSDIEAYNETMDVLDFCKKWAQNENVRVIMEDET